MSEASKSCSTCPDDKSCTTQKENAPCYGCSEQKTNVAKFFEQLKEVCFKFIENGGEILPSVFFLKDSSTDVVKTVLPPLPRELWQPFVFSMVKKFDADAYIFVVEQEIVAKPLNKPDATPEKDDNLLVFFAYFKDGSEQSDYMFISKDRKLLRDKRTIKQSSDLIIGNVYTALNMTKNIGA